VCVCVCVCVRVYLLGCLGITFSLWGCHLYIYQLQCSFWLMYFFSKKQKIYIIWIINETNMTQLELITVMVNFTPHLPIFKICHGGQYQNHCRQDVLDTTLCDKVCEWFEAGRWFSPDTPVSSSNEIDRRDITEILLKVALNTMHNPTPPLKTTDLALANSITTYSL